MSYCIILWCVTSFNNLEVLIITLSLTALGGSHYGPWPSLLQLAAWGLGEGNALGYLPGLRRGGGATRERDSLFLDLLGNPCVMGDYFLFRYRLMLGRSSGKWDKFSRIPDTVIDSATSQALTRGHDMLRGFRPFWGWKQPVTPVSVNWHVYPQCYVVYETGSSCICIQSKFIRASSVRGYEIPVVAHFTNVTTTRADLSLNMSPSASRSDEKLFARISHHDVVMLLFLRSSFSRSTSYKLCYN